jgi:hypothetical protein
MTDPLFTPLYPLSLDAAGLLEGTHITTRTTARKTDQYREAITMNSVWRVAALSRFLIFGPTPAPQVLERDKDSGDVRKTFTPDPAQRYIDTTLLWFKGNRESIVFAHPYADVKRLWNEYLLRQRSAP